ncbi:MAG: ABC transporter substrate-binding protein [Planctomycetaceae bacterium]|nr:ABC transporter substrate-binding protein [Planctomycetaceae bacterium]
MSPAASADLRKVSVIFHWKAQAQWAGYYMAREKGIYEKHGLDVALLARKGRSDSLDLLMDGRVTFATHFLSAGVGLRGAKQPVVHLAQVFNRSNLMVVARRSDGVEKVTDLSGKAVCFWDGYYRFVFKSFFTDQGVTNLRERPMGLTVSQFTSKQVAACSAMEYNEYNLIITSPTVDKEDLIFFRLREMGMDFPEDAIFTTEETAENDPELCRAFVQATFEGWEYARDNPEETLAVVMREVADDPDELVTEDHQRWMLGVCIDSVFVPPDSTRKTGVLSRNDFTVMHAFLHDNGQLRQPFSYEEFVRGDVEQ